MPVPSDHIRLYPLFDTFLMLHEALLPWTLVESRYASIGGSPSKGYSSGNSIPGPRSCSRIMILKESFVVKVG